MTKFIFINCVRKYNSFACKMTFVMTNYCYWTKLDYKCPIWRPGADWDKMTFVMTKMTIVGQIEFSRDKQNFVMTK